MPLRAIPTMLITTLGDMHKHKNAEFIYNTKMAVNSPKLKSALALYQKFDVTRSTIFMEVSHLLSKNYTQSPVWPFAALLL